MHLKLKRLVLAPLALALTAGACTIPEPVASERTIAQQLLSDTGDDARGFDGDWYDFDVVTQAVLLFPDLVQAASDPTASLTGFIPNDRAFQVLVYQLTGKLVGDEAGVFDAVASLGTDTVKKVLTYHLVGAKIAAKDALAANGAELTTVEGGKITVDVENPALSWIVLRDLDPSADDPGIVQSKFNYGGALQNGYLHGISLVLRPVDL